MMIGNSTSHNGIRWALAGIVAAMTVVSANAEILFQEDFDDQPDWHSGLEENNTGAFPVNGSGPDRIQRLGSHRVPEGWNSVRQAPTWAPSVGHPDRHEAIEILSSNADKARNGVGKSYVSWRDSTDPSSHWNSDSQLLKYFPEGHDQLYVEFWIRFGDNWTVTDSSEISKLFRVGSTSAYGGSSDNEFTNFGGGSNGPIAFWDWKQDSYGVRNVIALRGGPHGDNYTFGSNEIDNFRESMNFTTDTVGDGEGGTTPKIPDQVNGGYISDDLSQTVDHFQVFGDSGHWTKMAFFVKMNSAPGAKDGILRQWINNQRILNIETIPWVEPVNGVDQLVKWNYVSIGGNDYFHHYASSERREEWYSIDDILISTQLPNAPLPPSNATRVDSQ